MNADKTDNAKRMATWGTINVVAPLAAIGIFGVALFITLVCAWAGVPSDPDPHPAAPACRGIVFCSTPGPGDLDPHPKVSGTPGDLDPHSKFDASKNKPARPRPYFSSASALQSHKRLQVDFVEQGLPTDDHDCDSDDRTELVVSARVKVRYTCVGRVTGTPTLREVQNRTVSMRSVACGGPVDASVEFSPPRSALNCEARGEVLRLGRTQWSGVVIADVTHGVSISPAVQRAGK